MKSNTSINFSKTLNNIIELDKLSDNIIYLNDEELKYRNKINQIKEAQQRFLQDRNLKFKDSFFINILNECSVNEYYNNQPDINNIFLKTNRKETISFLENELKDCNKKLKDKLSAKDNLIKYVKNNYSLLQIKNINNNLLDIIENHSSIIL